MCLNDVVNHKLERLVSPQPKEHNFQVSHGHVTNLARNPRPPRLSDASTAAPKDKSLLPSLETKIDAYSTCFSLPLSLSLIFKYHYTILYYTIVKLRKSEGHLGMQLGISMSSCSRRTRSHLDLIQRRKMRPNHIQPQQPDFGTCGIWCWTRRFQGFPRHIANVP